MQPNPLTDGLCDGLHVERELRGKPMGQVFEARDTRVPFATNGTRMVRVLMLPSGEGAVNPRDLLLGRVEKLMSGPLSHVDVPREVRLGPDGQVCFVHEFLQRPLSGLIKSDDGLNGDEVREILGQLLTGLSALHDRGIAHGDLRPQNVFAEGTETSTRIQVRIADSAIGGLTAWSNGAMRSKESREYLPPEWKETTREPTPQADVYAVGLIACELLLGTNGNLRRHQPHRDVRWLRGQLRDRKIPADLRKVVVAFLADETERPHDGGAALRCYERAVLGHRRRGWRRAANVALVATSIALAACLGTIWGWWKTDVALAAARQELGTSQTQVAIVKQDVDATQKQLANVQQKYDESETQLATVTQERDATRATLEAARLELQTVNPRIPELRKIVGATMPSKPDDKEHRERAKKLWDEFAVFDIRAATQEDLRPPTEWDHLPPEERKDLLNWLKKITPLVTRSQRWRDHAEDLFQKVEDAFKRPWETDGILVAEQRLDALDGADKEWRKWAAIGGLSFADLALKVAGVQGPQAQEVQAILKGWLADCVGGVPATVRLTTGKVTASDADWGTTRLVTVYVADESAGDSGVHAWTLPTKHVYGEEPPTDIKFTWTPDQTIDILVEGGRGWGVGAKRNLIYVRFQGPLALWRLYQDGRVSNAEGRLGFEVIGCPGPPR